MMMAEAWCPETETPQLGNEWVGFSRDRISRAWRRLPTCSTFYIQLILSPNTKKYCDGSGVQSADITRRMTLQGFCICVFVFLSFWCITNCSKSAVITGRWAADDTSGSLSQSTIFLFHKRRNTGKESLSGKSRHRIKISSNKLAMANHMTSWGFAMSKIQGCQNVWWRSRFSSWCPGVHNLVSEVRRYPVSKIWGCRWGFWCPWNRQWLGRLRGCQPVPGPPTIPYYTITYHPVPFYNKPYHTIPNHTSLDDHR